MAKHNNESRQQIKKLIRLTFAEKLLCVSLFLQLLALAKTFHIL